MRSNRLLVIIVSFNSMQWAQKCYDSLRNSSIPCDIITIDNGSTDGTQNFIKENYPEVHLIETGENIGFGRANNIGLKKFLDDGYDFAYLLNQDAWVLPDTFEKLIAVSQMYPEYGILSPMQLQSCMTHFDRNFRVTVIGYGQNKMPSLVEDLYFKCTKDIYQVDKVMAAHWLLTRTCVSKVGGFSPSFPQYGEDDNFIQRAAHWELKTGIVPIAKAVHDRSNPVWNEEKEAYINYYIIPICRASNPINSRSLFYYILQNIIQFIIHRRPGVFNHSLRLLRQRGSIKKNLKISKTEETAFL